MSSPAARVRADLQARTGVDFAAYADDEFVDTVTGWSGIVALGKELAMALGGGLLVLVAAVVWAFLGDYGFDERVGLILGGLVAGVGTAVMLLSIRVRRRVPEEASKVFDAAGSMVEKVAVDLESGRLRVNASDAARGIAIVATIPAMTRATQRRFPLVGFLLAPAVGSLLSRALVRVWPSDGGGVPLTSLDRPARRLHSTLDSIRQSVLPRLARTVRWATLPLLAAGGFAIIMGLALAVLSLAAN